MVRISLFLFNCVCVRTSSDGMRRRFSICVEISQSGERSWKYKIQIDKIARGSYTLLQGYTESLSTAYIIGDTRVLRIMSRAALQGSLHSFLSSNGKIMRREYSW